MNTLKKLLYSSLLLIVSGTASAQYNEVALWPNGAPGSEGKTGKEKIRIYKGEEIVFNIHNPSITVSLPAKNKSIGTAVVIAPGGGHKELWMTHEGYNIAKWLNDHGIAAFILKYRLAKDTNSTYSVYKESAADVQRAIRLVHNRAKEWNVDTAKIGVIGFSAGGEVAALAGMRFDYGNPKATDLIDRETSRPAFQALIYPANAAKYEVVKNEPPVFLLAGYNDEIAKGMVEAYIKYKNAKVPAELHVYADVGHGFGIRETNAGAIKGWIDRFYEWLDGKGFLKK